MTTPFSLRARVRIPADTLVRVVEGESVILSLKNEAYYGLDEIGTRLWTHLSTSGSIEDACGEIRDEYEVSAEQVEKDVREFVEQLLKRGLVELVDDQVAPH